VLVCPACRSENHEDAQFCTTCGRSLSPDETALVATPRRETGELEIDVPAPRTQSAVPGIVALTAILVAGIGAATWFALRPNPCAGKFSSDRFPYCVTVPQGWQEAQVDIQGTPVDQFTPSNEGPTVFVHASSAPEGFDTQSYADALRSDAQESGLFPTAPRPLAVGGDEGLAWDVTKSDATTGSFIVERRIALVRDGMRWDILIFGKERALERALAAFERMLATWSWK
jgi:hypothetical protein